MRRNGWFIVAFAVTLRNLWWQRFVGDDCQVPTVEEHRATTRALLAPLAERAPEMWVSAKPPRGGQRRVLATDLVTPIDLPPFDNSQMDGYAVRSSEIAPGTEFAVAARIRAGSASPQVLPPGSAAPIMTGAPVPDGADAIIPIEAATPSFFQPEETGTTVAFGATVAPGTFVRPRGSDLPAGSLLFPAGTVLGPAQWGAIASAGIRDVPLLRPLRVLLLSTGDELTVPGEALERGHINDSNAASMSVAIAETGALVQDSLVIPDDPKALRRVFSGEGPGPDLVLTTGGVSVGAYEVVRDVFEQIGVEFLTVAMQPGGPQGAGIASIGTFRGPVVAFPGNPVSALVSFEIFLRPVLRALHGLSADRPSWTAPLAAELTSPPAKHQVRRGVISPDGAVHLVGGPSSRLLHSYAASTVLVHVPVGVAHLDKGDPVEVWSIDE
jgi:molybdopterin molybdotransferase